jgi:hypothetical protein
MCLATGYNIMAASPLFSIGVIFQIGFLLRDKLSGTYVLEVKNANFYQFAADQRCYSNQKLAPE